MYTSAGCARCQHDKNAVTVHTSARRSTGLPFPTMRRSTSNTTSQVGRRARPIHGAGFAPYGVSWLARLFDRLHAYRPERAVARSVPTRRSPCSAWPCCCAASWRAISGPAPEAITRWTSRSAGHRSISLAAPPPRELMARIRRGRKRRTQQPPEQLLRIDQRSLVRRNAELRATT